MKKHFTTSDYNKLTNDILYAKVTEKKLVNESDFSEFINNSYLNEKIKTLATKVEQKVEQLKAEQNKIVKLEMYELSYLVGNFFLVMMVFKIFLFINKHLIC